MSEAKSGVLCVDLHSAALHSGYEVPYDAQQRGVERPQPARIERRQIGAARGTLGDQLRQSFAGRRCVENAPDTVARGHVGALARLADQRQPVLGERTETGLARDDPLGAEGRRQPLADRLQAVDLVRLSRHGSRVERERSLGAKSGDVGAAVGARKHLDRQAPLSSGSSRKSASAGTSLPVS